MTENTNQPTSTTQIQGSQTAGMTNSPTQGAYAQREMQPPAVVYAPIPGVTPGSPVVPAQIAPSVAPTEQK